MWYRGIPGGWMWHFEIGIVYPGHLVGVACFEVFMYPWTGSLG